MVPCDMIMQSHIKLYWKMSNHYLNYFIVMNQVREFLHDFEICEQGDIPFLLHHSLKCTNKTLLCHFTWSMTFTPLKQNYISHQ